MISTADIENIIRTKGAIYAAADSLVASLGLSFSDIRKVYIAGAFGNKLDVANCMTIGLLPDMPAERVEFIGNSSVAGARIALVSNHAFEKAQTIAKKMTYFELSVSHDFMNEFIAALFLPHTNQELFPSVTGPDR